MPDPKVKIAWKKVTKRFDDKLVLDGLNLEAHEGRSLVIIGGSGSGKSVTIKLALGLLAPDAGRVEIDGRKISCNREDDPGVSQIGMLFQSGALFDSLNIWRNVAFRLLNADHMKPKLARERAIEAMEQVELSPSVAEQNPSELSGGMLKRVALARAIVTNPKILFFDEPTTGLDPVTADVINKLIVRQVKNLGATAVSITHDMASMRTIADDVAMIRDGKILWRGPLEDVNTCVEPEVCRFVEGRSDGD
ncbi:ABC transporter ATP-binding protein [Marinicauda salina]|uniref:ABC transporter ATP-binding protein n=1 Tax=Marinicauda salina TaxID=2135793 RepID=A0A2U2BUY6_9PROT|nr:ATP-binding cassette domain-containing protein [Marinicauda salina]PWE17846.1 ABC transporter ATP-binding protein [Marinicauda salina]